MLDAGFSKHGDRTLIRRRIAGNDMNVFGTGPG